MLTALNVILVVAVYNVPVNVLLMGVAVVSEYNIYIYIIIYIYWYYCPAIFIILFLAVLVLSANTSSTPNSATLTQISEGRQNGLESCLLAGLLIQTEISSIIIHVLKLKI